MLCRSSLVLLLLTLSFGISGPDQAASKTSLDAVLKERVDSGKGVGIVAAILEADGSSTVSAYGKSGPDALPLDADSVLEIGSITKVFTAAILADMAERGEVKFDDPVEKFLPAGVTVPRRGDRQITLQDLATHTSGLPRLPNNMAPANPLDPYVDYTADRLYAFLKSYELTRDIGALHEYSNLGAGLLGHALALRAGKSYEALVKERVLDPLGMTRTAITLTPWMKQHLALGHNAAGVVVANWNVGVLAGAGGLRSTANDMLRFARANLPGASGRLPRLMQQMHEIRKKDVRPDLSQALGWLVRHRGGQSVVWHNGGTGGYRSWMGFDPNARRAAIVLANSQHGADDLGFRLLEP